MTKLSPRQYEVAKLAARGFSNQEIANQMGIKCMTVRHYIQMVYAKIGTYKGHGRDSPRIELAVQFTKGKITK